MDRQATEKNDLPPSPFIRINGARFERDSLRIPHDYSGSVRQLGTIIGASRKYEMRSINDANRPTLKVSGRLATTGQYLPAGKIEIGGGVTIEYDDAVVEGSEYVPVGPHYTIRGANGSVIEIRVDPTNDSLVEVSLNGENMNTTHGMKAIVPQLNALSLGLAESEEKRINEERQATDQASSANVVALTAKIETALNGFLPLS